MEQNFQLIESIQNELIRKEKIFHNLNAVNNFIKINKENILLVNIRSLNKNLSNLQVFIKGLEVKPCIIVCTETRVLDHYKYFALDEYKIYYNNSKINVTDGVVIYVKNHIIENSEIVNEGRLCILESSIKLDNSNKLVISALYRAHDLPKTEFVYELKKYLKSKRNIKNHLVMGDYNIDILKNDSAS